VEDLEELDGVQLHRPFLYGHRLVEPTIPCTHAGPGRII
jgi:hypothetical protein